MKTKRLIVTSITTSIFICSIYSAELSPSSASHTLVAAVTYTLSKSIPLTRSDGSYNLLGAENFSALSTMTLSPNAIIITERNPKLDAGCTSHYIIYGDNVTTAPDPKDPRFNRSIVSQGTATISCLFTNCCKDNEGILRIASSHTEKRPITIT